MTSLRCRVIERATGLAIERSRERPSERSILAIERSSDRANADDHNSRSKHPFTTLIGAFCNILKLDVLTHSQWSITTRNNNL